MQCSCGYDVKRRHNLLFPRVQTIDEGPEERHDELHAPGQLSDADEGEPWIPDHPHKPKAARKINFDLHAAYDTQIEDVPTLTGNQQPADLPAEHAEADKAADRVMAQTGHRKAPEKHTLRGMQDATNQSGPSSDSHLQPQNDLHDSMARSATPARAQREMKQAVQQMQGLELCTEKEASERKALKTQPETDPAPKKDRVPAAANTYARASPHPKSVTRQVQYSV